MLYTIFFIPNIFIVSAHLLQGAESFVNEQLLFPILTTYRVHPFPGRLISSLVDPFCRNYFGFRYLPLPKRYCVHYSCSFSMTCSTAIS